MINEDIKEISDYLISSSSINSDFHPIDRFFLQPYIEQILQLDRNDFLLYNFEHGNTLYTSYLMLCLPELWKDITVEDLLNIIYRFTNDFSYFTFLYFTYKYVEIDSIKLILDLDVLQTKTRTEIKSYVKNQYENFVKDETDYLFFDVGAIGVKLEEWMYVKQNLLVDKRISPALLDLKQLERYVNSVCQ